MLVRRLRLQDTEAGIMFKRVLIAVDFSDASTSAVHWTARFVAPAAEIILAHVVDAPKPPAFLVGLLPPHDEVVESARVGAETRLNALAETLGPAPVRAVVRVGPAAEAIVALAAETGADLIALGGHGRRRGVWSLLGSTAEHVLDSAPVPVLLATNPPEGAPATLLTPVDNSPITPHVLGTAATLAREFGAGLIALNVFDPLMYGRVQLVSTPRAADEPGGEVRLAAEKWLEEQLAEVGIEPELATPHVALGVTSFEILAAASRYGAQLIVMGSRGESGIRRLLLGSVARSVLRGAGCPVLVLRAPAP
jgi:nucleotide-binding universal stress UspA family protein